MRALALKTLTIASLWVLLGCGKVYNSSSFDSRIFGNGGGGDGTPQFNAAKKVINQRCANCHTRSSHLAWTGMSEADFVAEGLVTPGSLEGSPLYTKIYGNRTAISGNMPQSASPLSSDELMSLENWISAIVQ